MSLRGHFPSERQRFTVPVEVRPGSGRILGEIPGVGRHNAQAIIADVAVARSILVIVWNLLSHPDCASTTSEYHTNRIDIERRTRNHVRQLEALGYTVSLTACRLT